MPEQRVCYVGKGSGNRAFEHKNYALRPHLRQAQKRLYTKLRGVLAAGGDFEPRIVYETDNELDALLKEKALIERHGFDNLFNVASHAFLGRRLKPEVRTTLAECARAMWRNPDYRRKNKTNKGRHFDYAPKLKLRRPKNRRSGLGLKGVSRWSAAGKSDRWMARITVNSVLLNLGYFAAPVDAARAYDDKAESVFGVRPNGTTK